MLPWLTVRAFAQGYDGPGAAARLQPIIDALRRTGMRDHADEDADFGVPPDATLKPDYWGKTPLAAPGARTIRTGGLAALLESRRPPVVVMATPGWRSVPGAVGLAGAGAAGTPSDAVQDRLRRKMAELTGGDLSAPVVALAWNSERFAGRNLALRLVALGYTDVYWYRGGQEAWEVAGLPLGSLRAEAW